MEPENLHFNKFPGDVDAVVQGPHFENHLSREFFIKAIRVWLTAHFFHSLNKCLLCEYVSVLHLDLARYSA